MPTRQPTKRLEIVIDAHHAPKAQRALRDAGVSGYTAIPNATGWGDRGERAADEITGVYNNCYLLCACTPEQAERALATLQPMIDRHGGLLLLSDAEAIQ